MKIKTTKHELVRQILLQKSVIKNYDAVYKLGITRLGAIIHVLRSQGWNIDTRREKDKLAVYTLLDTPNIWEV